MMSEYVQRHMIQNAQMFAVSHQRQSLMEMLEEEEKERDMRKQSCRIDGRKQMK